MLPEWLGLFSTKEESNSSSFSLIKFSNNINPGGGGVVQGLL